MKFIQSNIKHLRSLKGFSQERFADELGWTRSIVGSYEEGRSEPPIDRLIELSVYFNIPIDILVKNDLRRTKNTSFIEVGNKRVLFPVTVNDMDEDLIEIVPTKASAGYLQGYADPEYIEQLQKIKLPFLPTGTHRAFPISGDSMLPVKDGSFIVAKFMDSIDDVKNGRTYIVLTKDDGLVYKRVYNKIEEKGCLELHSDNKLYAPYDVKIADIMEIWEFTCCINTQEYSEEELKLSSIINMFQELKIELKSIKGLENYAL
ncbi:XRE family transcriptional regulator [Algibacter pacificus]|uniref:XRE family transcriptional regulator n=1 Tax=Algibacter pacificus TaxID=2599389 RepID=UPI0011CBBFFB|nr:XRE family transcriptional regulator [Algibacter pacificus]